MLATPVRQADPQVVGGVEVCVSLRCRLNRALHVPARASITAPREYSAVRPGLGAAPDREGAAEVAAAEVNQRGEAAVQRVGLRIAATPHKRAGAATNS